MQLRKLRQRGNDRRGGFTLMELLVVVAILVVLAGAAVPMYMKYLDQSKAKMAWTNAKTIEQVCDTYKLNNGDYPASLEDLLVNGSDGKPYFERKDLIDPFGNEYQYSQRGQHSTTGKPDIWSNGLNPNDPNGQIGNWQASAPK
jgi:general secretion pathway protein G